MEPRRKEIVPSLAKLRNMRASGMGSDRGDERSREAAYHDDPETSRFPECVQGRGSEVPPEPPERHSFGKRVLRLLSRR